MLFVTPRRRKPTPFDAVVRVLPDTPPWKNGHGRSGTVAVASATAGLALGTAAGAVLFTHRDKPAADEGEEQAPEGAQE